MECFDWWLLPTQTFQDWLNAIPECADLVVSYISLVVKNTKTIFQTISSSFVWKRQLFKKSKNNITRDADLFILLGLVYIFSVFFLSVLQDFQYQTEQQLEINESYVFQEILNVKQLSKFFIILAAEKWKGLFRCASISWFQVVTESVIHLFLQLAHLRVFQIYFY